jgi:hypothetical protein
MFAWALRFSPGFCYNSLNPQSARPEAGAAIPSNRVGRIPMGTRENVTADGSRAISS